MSKETLIYNMVIQKKNHHTLRGNNNNNNNNDSHITPTLLKTGAAKVTMSLQILL